MKFCTHCGKEIMDEAVVCPFCGCQVNAEKSEEVFTSSEKTVLKLIAFILCIVSTVLKGALIIPLAWMIPMTVVVHRSYKTGKQLSLGFKICVLIFVNIIAGVLLLCDTEEV